MIARNGRRRFVWRKFEFVPLVAISLAVGVVLVLVYSHWKGPETLDPADPVKADQATPADLAALRRELEWHGKEIGALREHIRGFEWGIQNLQRNIARIEFSIDQLKLGAELPSLPYDIKGSGREDQLRELEAIRADLEKQVGRAGESIERLESEIRDHETAIERLLPDLEGKAGRP
jgi:chromosome segregation ATPase